MTEFTLYIGNKNYSSWSMRGWLAVKQTELPFDEVVIPLRRPDTGETILRYSPSGRVPALKHGDEVIWDSLAIGEYLAETVPKAGLWPSATAARARARAVAAEMHSGFGALRTQLPINVRGSFPGREIDAETRVDLNRIAAIWRDCLNRYEGPCLFGAYSLADIMFAPVVSRLLTYKVELDEVSATYCAHIWELPQVKEFRGAAKDEPMVIEEFEF
jgi:glutathione S-transferase